MGNKGFQSAFTAPPWYAPAADTYESDTSMSRTSGPFQKSTAVIGRIPVTALGTHAQGDKNTSCGLRAMCLPTDASPKELKRIEDIVIARRKILRGETLFHSGARFSNIFTVRSGLFKTRVNTSDGGYQVTGFQLPGEVMGLDGIANDHYTCDAIALEDSVVCVMPFDRVEAISREVNALQRHMYRILGREILRESGSMLLLGNLGADERLAGFLLNLIQRMRERGFSSGELLLCMTREEIGSYLGMSMETVSRGFTRLAENGIVDVSKRHVHILDINALLMVGKGEKHLSPSAGVRRRAVNDRLKPAPLVA